MPLSLIVPASAVSVDVTLPAVVGPYCTVISPAVLHIVAGTVIVGSGSACTFTSTAVAALKHSSAA